MVENVSMTFCRNCGSEIPSGASFCPSCGANTDNLSGTRPTGNEFDRLTRDSGTQNHWVRRIIAYIIDAIIVGIILFVISFLSLLMTGLGSIFSSGSFAFNAFNPFSYFAGLDALLFFLYFTLSDYMYQKTFGKSLMGLLVVTTDGSKLDFGKCLIRNISKAYFLLLLLDLIVGFFANAKPGQKFSDHLVNTAVVSKR